ncbi:MAG TPA: glycoside hydrolase family 95 protein, partial [Sphingobacterium sp.]|nr:glycoside hydrolase family 95 protein [Sphingobacterium sp.]
MRVLFFFSFSLASICAYSQGLTMWYDEPATKWEETLPLGNGRIGMMPNGGIKDESIVLNEISLWSGGKQDPNNYEAYKSVDQIQQLLFDGKNEEAEKLVNQHFVCVGAGSNRGRGADAPYGCFQNFGFLNFLHFVDGEATGYVRKLDLENATAEMSFSVGDTHFLREYFTSHDKNVGIIRLSASKKKSIGFALHFYRDQYIGEYQIKDREFSVSGVLPNGMQGKGMTFAAEVKIVPKGGTSQVYDNQLIIKEADEVLIYIALSTDYYGHDARQEVQDLLRNSEHWRYASLSKAHRKVYHSYFKRVELQLEDVDDKSHLPTDVRIANFYQNPSQDNSLAALYYQFGRYLTLSSTSPHIEKALPPNLQGLWAHQIQTPWNGDYHLNVNAQMNHWGVEVGNLSIYHKPFLDMIGRLAKEGEKTAKAYYDAPGWVVYMMTNVWGYTAPGEHASWGASTASGWLCNHLWEHYQFTQDKAYLRKVYPILKGAAEFYQATLVRHPRTGWLVTSPSVSPENAFQLPNGKRASVAMGPTIDNQIVRELYTAVIRANDILGLDDEF